MVSFVILLIARTARIACADRHTYRHTHTHTHETTTVTLSAHARRGLITKQRYILYSLGDDEWTHGMGRTVGQQWHGGTEGSP